MKFNGIKKEWILPIIFGVFAMAILFLSLRGLSGNPDIVALSEQKWQGSGPFESSNDRGRFALTYSFVENHSFHFSVPVAQFAVPDLAITEKGEYVSLFAPGVSFLIMPGYIVGKYLGASQVGSFAVVAFFALMNVFLIYVIAKRLGANSIAAMLGALAFLFATPAFTYAVSLSQHHFSVFPLLLSIYLVTRWNNWWSLSLVWFLCALSVVIDNPNVFFMFPVGLYALGKIINLKSDEKELHLFFRPLYSFTFVAMIFPLVFFGWFNKISNGSPLQIAGTLQRVLSVPNQEGQVESKGLVKSLVNVPISEDAIAESSAKDKQAVNFFNPRNLLGGFYTHFTSRDRGMIWYAPVALLGIFGLILLSKKKSIMAAVIVASIGANVLLYSMWGDPWGGWSFGSRYLIPSYALLSIGLGIALTYWRKNFLFLILFFLVFSYSVRINTLGALGTSAIPPQAEVLELEKLTGKVQKYDFERSRDYLYGNRSKSFLFNEYFNRYISAYQYYDLLSGLIIVFGGSLVILVTNNNKKKV